jgi:RPA family protein
MMTELTRDNIENVLDSILSSAKSELVNKTQAQLEDYWYFVYETTKSKEWNLYHFTKALELYKSQCRKWEEYHNGNACVVERVRDKYLMSKIKSFVENMSGVES